MTMMVEEIGSSECIFCDIIAKKSPGVDVYEDQEYLVIMDKYPSSFGHVLVIPKWHYKDLLAMPYLEVGKLYSLVSPISEAVIKATQADGFNVTQSNGRVANQIVPHMHVHIIPRYGTEHRYSRVGTASNNPSLADLEMIAEDIRKELPTFLKTITHHDKQSRLEIQR